MVFAGFEVCRRYLSDGFVGFEAAYVVTSFFLSLLIFL